MPGLAFLKINQYASGITLQCISHNKKVSKDVGPDPIGKLFWQLVLVGLEAEEEMNGTEAAQASHFLAPVTSEYTK